MKQVVENMKKYVKIMKKQVENMKKFVEYNIRNYLENMNVENMKQYALRLRNPICKIQYGNIRDCFRL